MSFEKTGSSSGLMPCRPSFFASRWTAMKMPVKYKIAGRTARMMTFE